jgi:hypothetical protein
VSSLNYTLSVTRLPTYNDVMEEQTQSCKLCPEAVKRTLKTMLDMSLLSSPSFLILCLSGFITMMGFYVPFMYIKGWYSAYLWFFYSRVKLQVNGFVSNMKNFSIKKEFLDRKLLTFL